jgi:CPA1 family monovalent cation:H+ antiporter
MAEMIEAERDVVRKMRTEQTYPADVLRELERELDLDDSRLRARIRL